jgi:hypothetical protein
MRNLIYCTALKPTRYHSSLLIVLSVRYAVRTRKQKKRFFSCSGCKKKIQILLLTIYRVFLQWFIKFAGIFSLSTAQTLDDIHARNWRSRPSAWVAPKFSLSHNNCIFIYLLQASLLSQCPSWYFFTERWNKVARELIQRSFLIMFLGKCNWRRHSKQSVRSISYWSLHAFSILNLHHY